MTLPDCWSALLHLPQWLPLRSTPALSSDCAMTLSNCRCAADRCAGGSGNAKAQWSRTDFLVKQPAS
jgi:hypothetical protein